MAILSLFLLDLPELVRPGSRKSSSAGEISKALWSRYGSRPLRRSRSGVPPIKPYVCCLVVLHFIVKPS